MMGWYKTKNGISSDQAYEICDFFIMVLINLWENKMGRRPSGAELQSAFNSALTANIENGSIPKQVNLPQKDGG